MRLVIMPDRLGADRFLRSIYSEVVEAHSKLDIYRDDLVLFEGGTDISPRFYKERPGQYTQRSDLERDWFEELMWKKAKAAGAGMFGVCRGAQLLTALNGGKLIQHVTNHGGQHKITTSDGETLVTSSVHHQMMAPLDTKHRLLAWSEPARSKVYLDQFDKDCRELLNADLGLEPEAIWFPDTRSLGVQGHPEFLPDGHEFQKYCKKIIDQYIISNN